MLVGSIGLVGTLISFVLERTDGGRNICDTRIGVIGTSEVMLVDLPDVLIMQVDLTMSVVCKGL